MRREEICTDGRGARIPSIVFASRGVLLGFGNWVFRDSGMGLHDLIYDWIREFSYCILDEF